MSGIQLVMILSSASVENGLDVDWEVSGLVIGQQNNMKILVTGYKGYIGSEVFFRLKLLGLDPIGVEKNEPVTPADVIIHLACNLYGAGEEYIQNELWMARDVCGKTKKIVFTSSAAVYGNSTEPCQENQVRRPINDYGRAKVQAESSIMTRCKNYSILRLGNVYSKEADHGFISNLLKGGQILYGDGARSRDYVHLHDVVNVIIEAALTDKWKGIYNIATSTSITSKELFERFSKKTPIMKPKVEIEDSCLDISKARANGFSPFTI